MLSAFNASNSAFMADVDDISDSIVTSATGPKRVRVEGMGESEEHSLPDQIAAAKFRPPAAIRSRVGAGIKVTQMTPGGAA